jgi:DNA processing protein
VRAKRVVVDRELAGALGRSGPRLLDDWAAVAAAMDVEALWCRHVELGVSVALRGDPSYPEPFVDDPEPPMAVFSLGDPTVVAGVRVAVVGTRRCTRYGRDVAFELGRELSRAGVRVVSGLALGIDAAAHAGAVDADRAPPIAVVATGLDRTYPVRNGPLARQVQARGVVLTEYPLGVGPQPWRFPARNRLVAALADVLVVVETHPEGGSLYTVDEVEARGRPVLAVPGSIRSPASRGCNDLLADGRGPVRDVTDVLVELGLSDVAAESVRGPAEPEPGERDVLDALGWEPAALEHLVVRTGRSIESVSESLHRLRVAGRVSEHGGWFEQVARR